MEEFLKYLFDPGTFAILLGGLLTTIFGLFAATIKEERIPRWIVWGSCFAGLIVLMGGIYSGFEEQKMSNNLQAKAEKIANLSDKIIKLEEDNSQLSGKIADFVTGGDSYLDIKPFIPVRSNMIQFRVWNPCENPLYDVYLKILDLTMLNNLDYAAVYKNQSLDPLEEIQKYNTQVSKAAISLNLGNISPNNLLTLGPYDITGAKLGKKEQSYLITIVARNGSSSVEIKAIKKVDSWEYS